MLKFLNMQIVLYYQTYFKIQRKVKLSKKLYMIVMYFDCIPILRLKNTL